MKKFLTAILAVAMCCALISAPFNVSAEEEFELLEDNGFEEQDDFIWVPYVGGVVDFSDEAYEGDSCLIVTERTHPTDVVRQYITEKLDYYGQGKYTFSAYVKLAEESEHTVQISAVVGAYADQKKWASSDKVTLSADEWTHISITKDITWVGELVSAEFYFITDETNVEVGDFANILIDSCSLVPVGYSGEVYKTPEPTPTPTPTVKPTSKPTPEATPASGSTNTTTQPPAGESTPTDEAVPDGQQENNGTSKQAMVIGGMIIACGVILAAGAVALFISYRKEKKNDAVK